MSFFRLSCLTGPALSVALAGCAGKSQALEKRLADLETQLTQVQNENDRLVERVGSLELQRAAAPPPQPAASDEPTVLERPPLKVIRVDPNQARAQTEQDAERQSTPAAGPDADSPSPEPPLDPKRPVLRLRGNKGGFRQGSGQPPRS
jgi:hypothetical protein